MTNRVLAPLVDIAVESMMDGLVQPIEDLLMKNFEFSETCSKRFYGRIAELLRAEAQRDRLTLEGRRLCWLTTQISYKLSSQDRFQGHTSAMVEFRREVANDLHSCLRKADPQGDCMVALMRIQTGSLRFQELYQLRIERVSTSDAALACFASLYEEDLPPLIGVGPRSIHQWIIDDALFQPRSIGRGLIIARFLGEIHDVMSSTSPLINGIDAAPSLSTEVSDKVFDARAYRALKRLLQLSRPARSGAAILLGGLISLARVHDTRMDNCAALLKNSTEMFSGYGQRFVGSALDNSFVMWTKLYDDFGVS